MASVRGRNVTLGDTLTDRERQVYALLQDGHSNLNISLLLGIAEETVKFFVSCLLVKMGARTRLELVTNSNAARQVEYRKRDLRITITRLEHRLASTRAELAILNEEQPHEKESKVFDLSSSVGDVAGVRPDLVQSRPS